jgi:hypothetical protein
VILVRPSDPLARAIANIPWQRLYVDRSYSIYARPGLHLPPSIATTGPLQHNSPDAGSVAAK